MVAYVVEKVEDVCLKADEPLRSMDWMSPFVWRDNGGLRLLMRGVPRPMKQGDPSGVIFAGKSDDGLTFAMHRKPAIAGGPEEIDAGGVEDPTVHVADDGLMVFFTGVEANRPQGSLLVATGPDMEHLTKREVTLKAPEGEGNIKEATLAQSSDGSWRLFYEYARENASRIGVATAPELGGEWTPIDDPCAIREKSWDNWHLSTGPIVSLKGHDPVMFYNGATADARWRIGWMSFSPDFGKVTARGVEPLIMPPPPEDRAATDIAFAASALVIGDDLVHLYYSLEDRRLARACVRAFD